MSDVADEIVKQFTQSLSKGSKKKSSKGAYSFNVSESARIQYLQQLAAVWLRLWGEKPQKGYIERAAAAGMSLSEFEAHERAKPAFKFSPTYQEERVGTELELARNLGGLG